MVGAMFIRRTQTRRTEDGKPYFSHRLVHAERLGSSVRQRTLLNLGRHFDIPQADWPLLCARINDALSGQAPLVADCPPAVEEEAQRIAAQFSLPWRRKRNGSRRDRPRRGRADRRTDRCAAGRCRLVAAGPPPQRRRGAGRPVGARATGPAGAADPVGRQRRPAQRGHRRHRRASGRARLGARDAPLAAGAQRSRGVARRRLRDRRCDAALPRLGRAGEASRGDRGASVRPRDGAVRPAADGDALRPDQHLLRGRGERPAAGATRALEREAPWSSDR